jgi:hypothetical protein
MAKDLPTMNTADAGTDAGIDPLALKSAQQGVLTHAEHREPGKIFLRFADGLSGEWTFAELGFDMCNMKPESINAQGATMTLLSKWNDVIEVDAASLRAEIDPNYREQLNNALAAVRGPIESVPSIDKLTR